MNEISCPDLPGSIPPSPSEEDGLRGHVQRVVKASGCQSQLSLEDLRPRTALTLKCILTGLLWPQLVEPRLLFRALPLYHRCELPEFQAGMVACGWSRL